MDFDPILINALAPKSQSKIDVRNAYSHIVPQALEAMGPLVAEDLRYASNEEGHLAWDLSLLTRAAILAWRTTGDPDLLITASDWATHLCSTTDEARGKYDWRGRSGPIWSAGSRYTAGTATIGHFHGVEVRIQSAAQQVSIERPSDTTAIIKTIQDGKTVWESPEASLLPADKNYLPDVLARRSSVRSTLLRGLVEPIDLSQLMAGVYDLRPLFASHLVHAGMIARALLEVADALTDAGDYRAPTPITPNELVNAAERALVFHDEEIVTEGGHAWYITPLDFPGRRLGLPLPYNHYCDPTTIHLYLASHYRNKERRDLALALARSFMEEIAVTEAGELPHFWYYYPVGSDSFCGVNRKSPMAERIVRSIARAEDASHATARVRALADWHELDPASFPDKAMESVAKSFQKDFLQLSEQSPTLRWLPGDDPYAPRHGFADSYSGAWSRLAPWHEPLRKQVNLMAQANPPREIFGATALSAAEILAMNWDKPAYPKRI